MASPSKFAGRDEVSEESCHAFAELCTQDALVVQALQGSRANMEAMHSQVSGQAFNMKELISDKLVAHVEDLLLGSKAVNEASKSLSSVAPQLQGLKRSLSGMPHQVQEACSSVGEIVTKRSMAKSAHSKLQDLSRISELPVLAQQAAIAGSFEHAVDAIEAAEGAAARLGNSKIAERLVARTSNSRSLVARRLVEVMQGPLTLAKALSALSAAKRLEPSLSWLSLGASFLSLRVKHFQQEILGCDGMRPYALCCRITDLLRTIVGDSSAAFEAAFRASSDGQECQNMLVEWVKHVSKIFLDAFMHGLDQLSDAGSLLGALEAACFASSSLGRYGCDLTPILCVLLKESSLRLVKRHISDAASELRRPLIRIPGHAYSGRQLGATNGNRMQEDGEDSILLLDEDELLPPSAAASWPVLSAWVNCMATALNVARECVPNSAGHEVCSLVSAAASEALALLESSSSATQECIEVFRQDVFDFLSDALWVSCRLQAVHPLPPSALERRSIGRQAREVALQFHQQSAQSKVDTSNTGEDTAESLPSIVHQKEAHSSDELTSSLSTDAGAQQCVAAATSGDQADPEGSHGPPEAALTDSKEDTSGQEQEGGWNF